MGEVKHSGIKIIRVGKIRRVPVPCPCCGTVYEVPLCNDYCSDVRVTMDTLYDGYFPVLRMPCSRCGVFFTHVVRDAKNKKEGGNDVST